MKAEEVFKAGLGALVVYPKWHKNGKDRVFRIRGYELGEEYVSLTDGVIQTKTHISFIKPIPLTTEELVKLGFEEYDNGDYILRTNNGSGSYFWFITGISLLRFMCKTGYMLSGAEIKSMHQLQNLYHSLKGEELQYKND